MLDESQPWSALLIGLIGVAGLVSGLVGLAFAVWLMIWPVERRARATQGPFRFLLIDMGCLLVYWQVILAAAVALGREGGDAVGLLATLSIVLVFISTLTWVACVSVLARAGIESSARRAAFILVSIPGAIAAAVTLVVSGGLTVAVVLHLLVEPPTGREFVPAVIFLATCGVIFLLRLVSLWIAADARGP